MLSDFQGERSAILEEAAAARGHASQMQEESGGLKEVNVALENTISEIKCENTALADEYDSLHVRSVSNYRRLSFFGNGMQNPNLRCVFSIGFQHLRCWGSQPKHVSNPAYKEV